jgi:hypothetical protein
MPHICIYRSLPLCVTILCLIPHLSLGLPAKAGFSSFLPAWATFLTHGIQIKRNSLKFLLLLCTLGHILFLFFILTSGIWVSCCLISHSQSWVSNSWLWRPSHPSSTVNMFSGAMNSHVLYLLGTLLISCHWYSSSSICLSPFLASVFYLLVFFLFFFFVAPLTLFWFPPVGGALA